MLRRWHLALHPLCLQCPSLLSTSGADAHGMPEIGAPDTAARQAQALIAQDLEPDRLRSGSVQRRFANLYLLCEIVAASSDTQWPKLPAWEHDLRTQLPQPRTDWSRRPPATPSDAAIVVLECARALADPQRQRQLQGEAVERLDGHHSDAARALVRRHNAGVPWAARPALPNVPSSRTQPVLASLIKTIQRLQRTSGIQARHLPAWPVEEADALVPTRDYRRELERRAVILHILLSGRWHDPGAEARARRDLGLLTRSRRHRALQDAGIDAMRAAHVARTAEHLIGQGLVDHHDLRQRFATPTGLLTSLRRKVPNLPPASDVVLAAWCRLHLTPGPANEVTLADVRVLDEALNPEQRLQLLDAVDEHLHAVDPPAVNVPSPAVPAQDRSA
ncbi:hypothetical protein GCM10007368_30520 [Isoptericola cucumis]|uniref:Uncharacterized protein n=2 Tax=Isoptericola cucumis TaxID=1776856 RepID=A0ABQ2B8K7_9MICO|nr:hypothetical protein GCM10007368_30520 [Isoptericola cucumis]